MITPNESESEILTNIRVTDQESAVLAGKKIVSKGVQNCIITLGKNGSVWCTKKSTYIFKVPKINAIDTTAAGDVFNGYLAQGIINGSSLTEAILFSHAASCLSVTVKGAQTSIPSKEDTLSFLKKNKGFTFKKIK
jgi:ribokinase